MVATHPNIIQLQNVFFISISEIFQFLQTQNPRMLCKSLPPSLFMALSLICYTEHNLKENKWNRDFNGSFSLKNVTWISA